ncbi:F-actin-capping protein subunit alpha [Recurvomyces mirabilis]|uniref:F-actin-capping protein subunit alpha n=1 Tax=Recurvomyces mirabilis TaxID=574656 RepID=A0AAE0WLJ4_9PEZI|nr:F-actin-capping protein subunit alpha [Recurvomyces mirabilis]KAK5151977.1 F-actin-capping protein subunit alpha [Recurvomyces mirabilis]
MSSKSSTVASFVEAAPPGELSNVVADIKALSPNEVSSLGPAFQKYNEEQYATIKIPGSSEATASGAQSHPLESPHADTIKSLQKSFSAAASEHFPSSTIGIYPNDSNSSIAILLVANKYSPQNFWNGRWRSTYHLTPSNNSVTGSIKVDVHYYEDGNVRMSTSRKVELSSSSADGIVREIAKAENKFQEELNRAFTTLAEGSFKGLRRQLPVTRQKVEWEKIGGYRLGQDIGGGRSK